MKSLSIIASTPFAISSSPPHRPSGVARSTALDSSALVPGSGTMRPGGGPPGRANALRRLLGFGAGAGVAERDVGAARRELTGDHEPDAPAAGNQRDFVLQIHETQMQPRKHEDTKKKN